MSPTFCPATTADIPLLRDLADRIWRVCYAEMISAEQIDYMLRWMYSPEKIAEELAAGVCWEVVRLGEQAVGYLALSVPPEGAEAELHKLYLLPELQGQGLGQAMLSRACGLAKAAGAEALRLRVNKRNHRALKAYARAGFSQVEEAVAEIGGGFVMDDYFLRRGL